MLEGVLLLITLGIGWFIWAMIAFKNGQTPAKQVLKMRVVRLQNGSVASWGTMFLREVIAKPIIGTLSWLTLGIINFWLVWDTNNQQLYDKVVNTIVVDDPSALLVAR